jgi:hypothetical protein
VNPYDVGTYRDLKGSGLSGDNLDIHHAPQQHLAQQVLPGFDYYDAPAIALPHGEHVGIPRVTGQYTGTPQQLLQDTLNDLINNTGAPQSSLDDLQAMWRQRGWW